MNGGTTDQLEPEIDALLAQGFGTFKVKVGFDARVDAERLRTIQRVTRGRAAIRVDANQGFGVEEAKWFASGMDPEGIELFEQPCAAGDWEAACAVAAVSTVPMMLDESIYGVDDIRRAAELRAARYIKVKLMKLGSLERLVSAVELIRALGMEPVLGNGVACEVGCWMEALVARTHIRNAGEMNGYLKQAEPLLANPPRFANGAIQLEPGYRPELDRAAVRRVARASARVRRGGASALARPRVQVSTRTIITGVIGSDTHIVGNRILSMALERAGYKVVALGALTPAHEFVKAAVETDADAILVSSLYGQGELDCRGFRELCVETGLDDILLYVGGNLIVGKHPWPEVERMFLDMGFDRAAAHQQPEDAIDGRLGQDACAREFLERGRRLGAGNQLEHRECAQRRGIGFVGRCAHSAGFR